MKEISILDSRVVIHHLHDFYSVDFEAKRLRGPFSTREEAQDSLEFEVIPFKRGTSFVRFPGGNQDEPTNTAH